MLLPYTVLLRLRLTAACFLGAKLPDSVGSGGLPPEPVIFRPRPSTSVNQPEGVGLIGAHCRGGPDAIVLLVPHPPALHARNHPHWSPLPAGRIFLNRLSPLELGSPDLGFQQVTKYTRMSMHPALWDSSPGPRASSQTLS